MIDKRKRRKIQFGEEKKSDNSLFSSEITIPSFHMWSLDLSPATAETCCQGIGAAAATVHRLQRGASRRRGRASPVMQPLAAGEEHGGDERSFPGAPEPLLPA